MSLLSGVAPEAATGDVAEIYAEVKTVLGGVPNVIRIWSASPVLLRQQWEFIKYSLNHPTLSGALSACVRMLVSQRGRCDYCIDLNAEFLVELYGWTPDQVAAVRADPKMANLPERERDMLLMVLKAVENPHGVDADELDALRARGWSDRDIFDAMNHGARTVAGDTLISAFKVERDF